MEIHPIWILCESLALKMKKTLIKSQTIVKDYPFLQQNPEDE